MSWTKVGSFLVQTVIYLGTCAVTGVAVGYTAAHVSDALDTRAKAKKAVVPPTPVVA